MPSHPFRSPLRPFAIVGAGALAVLGLAFALGAQDDGLAGLDATRATIEKWQETRRVIAEEKRRWVVGRERLQDRILIVKDETDDLRAKTVETEDNITASEEKRIELTAENEKLKEAVVVLEDSIDELEDRVRTLLTQLPQPIVDRVGALTKRLPQPGATIELSLSERYANVIGIINEVDKYNREVHVVNEERELANGTTALVLVMYVGIGHAYYVSEKGDAAGLGTLGPDGWVWTPLNQAAEAIALAIAIHNNEEPAAFVPLPIQMN